jgi:hypothetical protein
VYFIVVIHFQFSFHVESWFTAAAQDPGDFEGEDEGDGQDEKQGHHRCAFG